MALMAGADAPPAAEDVEGRKALLRVLGVALWDMVASCEITGSSDAGIRNVQTNDQPRQRRPDPPPSGRNLAEGGCRRFRIFVP
jgi:hypothetical protein